MKKKSLIIIISLFLLALGFNYFFNNTIDSISQAELDSGVIFTKEFNGELIEIESELFVSDENFLNTRLIINSNIIDVYPQEGSSRAYINDIFVENYNNQDYLFVIVYWDSSNLSIPETFNTTYWNVYVYDSNLNLEQELSSKFNEGFAELGINEYEFSSKEKIKKVLSKKSE